MKAPTHSLEVKNCCASALRGVCFYYSSCLEKGREGADGQKRKSIEGRQGGGHQQIIDAALKSAGAWSAPRREDTKNTMGGVRGPRLFARSMGGGGTLGRICCGRNGKKHKVKRAAQQKNTLSSSEPALSAARRRRLPAAACSLQPADGPTISSHLAIKPARLASCLLPQPASQPASQS